MFGVETALSRLEAARGRPPPVASFNQSAGSTPSRPGQSRRESNSGGGETSSTLGGTSGSAQNAMRGGGGGTPGTGTKRPRPRGGEEDDSGDLDALVNGGGRGAWRGAGGKSRNIEGSFGSARPVKP